MATNAVWTVPLLLALMNSAERKSLDRFAPVSIEKHPTESVEI